MPSADLGFATVDLDRERRTGFPEVVMGEGKIDGAQVARDSQTHLRCDSKDGAGNPHESAKHTEAVEKLVVPSAQLSWILAVRSGLMIAAFRVLKFERRW